MKNCIFMVMVALLVSCSDQQLLESVTEVNSTELMETSDNIAKISALVEKARWGDGQAFLQLADCYREGFGVEKDFLSMMCMVERAYTFGTIESENDYLSRLSEDNAYKQCYNLMNKSSSKLINEKDSIMAILNAIDSPDALAIGGIVYVECGDTIGGFEMIRKAANNGSNFASLLMTVSKNNGELQPDKDKLEQIADKSPIAYKILGGIYCDLGENNDIYKRKAAICYKEAEKHALLSKREATWLLFYYRDGGNIQLSDEDVRRLETFSDIPVDYRNVIASDIPVDYRNVIASDTICLDSVDN